MAELLIEVGIEEVPARMLSMAVSELSSAIEALLKAEGLHFERLQAHGAPRQLLVFSSHVQACQDDREETIYGPPVRIAYDSDGNPTKALEGFLKKTPGLTLDKLEREIQPKGEVVCGKVFVKGCLTCDILANALPGILAKLSFPKKMTWGTVREPFVRPVRNILALLDGTIIPFEFAGVKSGNQSFGHRFHGQARFEVSGLLSYLELKKKNAIIVASQDRVAMIKEQIDRHLASVHGRLVPDENLMRELPELVEIPFVVFGRFQDRFLEIPREILITSLREHQKSFCVEDEKGQLMPYFLAVASTLEDAKGLIVKGNEWVLKARLWDAHFFWGSDRKKDFDALRQKLKSLVFQVKIGDYYTKTERIEALTTVMAETLDFSSEDTIDVRYAARHCKTDLFTELVFEFPELQGVIGGLLLGNQGKRPFISKAVYEHYLPSSLEGDMPIENSSCLISIADKLDTLTGCFGVGLKPTGTKDPYALRRAAQGIIRILMEKKLPLNLAHLIKISITSYQDVLDFDPSVQKDIEAFFLDRIRFIMKSKGLAHDLIEAVLAADSNRVDLLLPRSEAVLGQLSKPNFISLFRNLKRMDNVIQDELDLLDDLDESLFENPIERDLWALFSTLKSKIEAAVASFSYNAAMDAMADLVDPVETYFSSEGVFVNCEDEKIRLNRKSMLKTMRDTLGLVADLTRLEVK